MSGMTPSKARAPSNTEEPSQAACVRGPIIGGLPSSHLPSSHVQVLEYQLIAPPAGVHVLRYYEARVYSGLAQPLMMHWSFHRRRSLAADAGPRGASAALAGAGAHTPAPSVQLEAAARSELPNDEMVVQLAVERSGPIAEKLNDEVLDALNLAHRQGEGRRRASRSGSGSITTQPEWGQQGKRTGWRVRGVMVLEGRDLKATGALAGQLSEDLQIAGVSFRLTDAARTREESRLLEGSGGGLQRTRARDRRRVRLRRLRVEDAQHQPRHRIAAAAADADGDARAAACCEVVRADRRRRRHRES